MTGVEDSSVMSSVCRPRKDDVRGSYSLAGIYALRSP